ncbi:MAG: alpha/beta hydrolase [Pseudomonadota bacterium]
MFKFFQRALVGVAIVYVAALGFLYVAERSMVYPAGGDYEPPESVGLEGVEVFELETPDGERLLTWYHPPEDGEKTFLYLQGNSKTLSDRTDALGSMVNGGYGLLAISYRGFHGSTGSATQDGLTTDALTAFDWLAERDHDIIIHGQSLGSGVASQLAAQRDAVALILEVPFTATVDVASEQYWFFPVGLLMKDQWRSRDVIADVGEPLLIVGAGQDRVIPVEQSKRLYDMASDPKTYAVLPESGHNDVWDHGMWEQVESFLSSL